MNDRAREALVAAALKGTKQIRGSLQDFTGGVCALGVFFSCLPNTFSAPWSEMEAWADLEPGEDTEIARRNDLDGWDFLTIARKVGVPDGESVA